MPISQLPRMHTESDTIVDVTPAGTRRPRPIVLAGGAVALLLVILLLWKLVS
jgi:hypothetical protein